MMQKENIIRVKSGWGMLILELIILVGAVVWFINTGMNSRQLTEFQVFMRIVPGVLILIAGFIGLFGFMVVPPNKARVLLLFGKYIGSVKDSGFKWVNPFYSKHSISLRLRNLNGEKLKVNDKSGNPIEIAAVIVWQVSDTYEASFEVDDYEDYVHVQSESALRHLASYYPYDSWEEVEELTLRGNIDEVSKDLEKELQERLGKAGVIISEARLSHLAYAQEIAEAMLRRQQATAIVAARQKIVEGAVGMVEMALALLRKDNIVELDDERKAAMVSNLLVVLCGETNAQPIVNAGTLYT
jgi:regulator of protease activity HflC (stomatin/prohibitin superfamily)